MSSETNLKDAALRWLNHQPDTFAVKMWGGPYARAGMPDILMCVRGLYIAIELKVGDNMPTKLQSETGRRIQAAGGSWSVGRSMEDVKMIWNTAILYREAIARSAGNG